MKVSILTLLPFWLIVLCVVLGVAYASILYYKNKSLPFGSSIRILLFFIRAFVVSFMAFLLLSPILHKKSNYDEKPIVVLAVDNSQSMRMSKDSVYIYEQLNNDIKNLKNRLSKRFEVVELGFGSNAIFDNKIDFKEKRTDISNVFAGIDNKLINRNIASLILLSDGINNYGGDPFFSAENVKYDINTIAIGDTTPFKDIRISKISNNKISYLGNDFPVVIDVSADKLQGEIANIAIFEAGNKVFSSTLNITSDKWFKSISTHLKATKAGLKKYHVVINKVSNEKNIKNNYSEFYVEVLENRQKILLLYASPHPDIAALNRAISNNDSYVVETAALSDFTGNISSYSMVVLHQVPHKVQINENIFAQLEKNKSPCLYIVGSQSNIQRLNNLSIGVKFPLNNLTFENVNALYQREFNNFIVPENIEEFVNEMPPLSAPTGEYTISPVAKILFKQKIGSIQTGRPLISFVNDFDRRSGVISGEGIWRWRMIEFQKANQHNMFDGLIGSIIQYLTVKGDRGRFRMNLKNQYDENESIKIDAELYNEAYELINTPDVNLEIKDSVNTIYQYTLSKNINDFTIDIGCFPVGQYTYTAKTSFGGENFIKSGHFSVSGFDIETQYLVANHGLLFNIAKNHNGKMYYTNQVEQLIKDLNENDKYKTIIYSRNTYKELINFIAILLGIISLLAIEWFLRKYHGSY